MLQIYSGYNLANKTANITFNIDELMPHQEVIDIVTNFVQSSKALEDESIDVSISTNNPLVIATIEAIAMETDNINNLKYIYITEDNEEHLSHYVDDRVEGEHHPNEYFIDLKSCYYRAFYARKRKGLT